MNIKIIKSLSHSLFIIGFALALNSCSNSTTEKTKSEASQKTIYPSDVIPFMDKFKILLGDGTKSNDLVNYEDKDFFYAKNDNKTNWVVYKTPNSGITSFGRRKSFCLLLYRCRADS